MPFQHRCPRCRSQDVERIRRRGAFERVVLALLRRRPYQCLDCGVRFYDRPTPEPYSDAA